MLIDTANSRIGVCSQVEAIEMAKLLGVQHVLSRPDWEARDVSLELGQVDKSAALARRA